MAAHFRKVFFGVTWCVLVGIVIFTITWSLQQTYNFKVRNCTAISTVNVHLNMHPVVYKSTEPSKNIIIPYLNNASYDEPTATTQITPPESVKGEDYLDVRYLDEASALNYSNEILEIGNNFEDFERFDGQCTVMMTLVSQKHLYVKNVTHEADNNTGCLNYKAYDMDRNDLYPEGLLIKMYDDGKSPQNMEISTYDFEKAYFERMDKFRLLNVEYEKFLDRFVITVIFEKGDGFIVQVSWQGDGTINIRNDEILLLNSRFAKTLTIKDILPPEDNGIILQNKTKSCNNRIGTTAECILLTAILAIFF